MPPQVATLVTIALIVYLFRRDLRESPNVSRGLWLPLFWMVISGSRSIFEWLNIFGIPVMGAATLEEGSPADRIFYLCLIGLGIKVLSTRGVRLRQVIHDNRWLAAFLIYCLLAVIWSDYPFVALKRWIKVVGHPIMVLIILTEPDPEEALRRLMKRAAYILIPVSILFIKYYPEYGRSFSFWTGGALNTGIAADKNLLGADCLILGVFFVWHFLRTRQQPKTRHRRAELTLCVVFLAMIWWLFSNADSKTPLICFLVAVFIIVFAGWRSVNKRALGAYIISGLLFLAIGNWAFNWYNMVLRLLGRDATLTERTFLWNDLLRAEINPLLGAGFESFWLGPRLYSLWEKFPFRPNQAHNGYLETYLNLGLLGLFLLIGVIFATYGKARRDLIRGRDFGRFRLGFLTAAVVYNWTEAGFKTTGLVFFVFYIVAIDLRPLRRARPVARPVRKVEPATAVYAPQPT